MLSYRYRLQSDLRSQKGWHVCFSLKNLNSTEFPKDWAIQSSVPPPPPSPRVDGQNRTQEVANPSHIWDCSFQRRKRAHPLERCISVPEGSSDAGPGTPGAVGRQSQPRFEAETSRFSPSIPESPWCSYVAQWPLGQGALRKADRGLKHYELVSLLNLEDEPTEYRWTEAHDPLPTVGSSPNRPAMWAIQHLALLVFRPFWAHNPLLPRCGVAMFWFLQSHKGII